MPVLEAKRKEWNHCVEINDDPYGGACVAVARRVMELLDENEGEFDCHAIICQADKDVKAGGITGFMAGCVAGMVAGVHSRGEEFRQKWNLLWGRKDGEKANEDGGTINPAIITIDTDK